MEGRGAHNPARTTFNMPMQDLRWQDSCHALAY